MPRSPEQIASAIAVLAQSMREDGDVSDPRDSYRFVERDDGFVYAYSLTESQADVGGILRHGVSVGWEMVDLQPDLPLDIRTPQEKDDHDLGRMEDWWQRVKVTLAHLGFRSFREMTADDAVAFLEDVSAWIYARRLIGMPIGQESGLKLARIVDEPHQQTVCIGTVGFVTDDWDEERWYKLVRDHRITHFVAADMSSPCVTVDEFLSHFTED